MVIRPPSGTRPGSHRSTVSSSLSRCSPTSWSTTTATKVFVMLPVRKRSRAWSDTRSCSTARPLASSRREEPSSTSTRAPGAPASTTESGDGRVGPLRRPTSPTMIAIDPTNARAMRMTAFRPIHLTGPAYGSRGPADDMGIAVHTRGAGTAKFGVRHRSVSRVPCANSGTIHSRTAIGALSLSVS